MIERKFVCRDCGAIGTAPGPASISAVPTLAHLRCLGCGLPGYLVTENGECRCEKCGHVGPVLWPPPAPPAPAQPAPSAPAHPGCSLMLAEVQEWAARHAVVSTPGAALHLAWLACELGDCHTAAVFTGAIYARTLLALARLADAHGVRLSEAVAAEMRARREAGAPPDPIPANKPSES